MKHISNISLFRAFRSRNYALYFTGRSVSQFGTWMQRTAVIWVIYTITHSAFMIGVTIFAEQFPSFLFSMLGGIAADRYDKFRIIKIAQIASMIQAVLLAALVVTGHMQVWAILALSVALGVINAFDVPARQSLIHQVIADEADLPNALSLTTAMASLAQLLGPALSGIVLNAFGASVCFIVNAASFGGVIISLLLMKRTANEVKLSDKKMAAEFTEGFVYIRNTPRIGTLILMLTVVSLLVLPYNTVLPVFAKVIFKGDASTFGYITSFIGAGAVLCTIFIASRKAAADLRRILWGSLVLLAVGLVGFSLARNFGLAMLFASITGFGAMAQFTICNIVVQSETSPHIRGRVIGILIMAIVGVMPVGSLLVGAVSQRIGAPVTVLCQGIIALVIAISFFRILTTHTKKITASPLANEEEEVLIERVG